MGTHCFCVLWTKWTLFFSPLRIFHVSIGRLYSIFRRNIFCFTLLDFSSKNIDIPSCQHLKLRHANTQRAKHKLTSVNSNGGLWKRRIFAKSKSVVQNMNQFLLPNLKHFFRSVYLLRISVVTKRPSCKSIIALGDSKRSNV